MNKKTVMMVGLAVLAAVGVYVAFRWYQARQGNQVGGLGTNLNSVAPELIGGSTGPSVGPALNTPITITLNEAASATSPAEIPGEAEMKGVNTWAWDQQMMRQRNAASAAAGAFGSPPDDTGDTMTSPGDVVDGGPNSDQTDQTPMSDGSTANA